MRLILGLCEACLLRAVCYCHLLLPPVRAAVLPRNATLIRCDIPDWGLFQPEPVAQAKAQKKQHDNPKIVCKPVSAFNQSG